MSKRGLLRSAPTVTGRASPRRPLFMTFAFATCGSDGRPHELPARRRQQALQDLFMDRHAAPSGRSDARTGRTNSAIAALNLVGSSTNGSWPDSSNQTSLFEGAVNASR